MGEFASLYAVPDGMALYMDIHISIYLMLFVSVASYSMVQKKDEGLERNVPRNDVYVLCGYELLLGT